MTAARLAWGLVALATTAGTSAGFALLDGGVDIAAPYAGSVGEGVDPSAPQQDINAPYDGLYHFARVQYSGGGSRGFGRRRGGGATWAHDWPRADRHFLAILQETTLVRTTRVSTNVVSFNDPELFRNPISYVVEPGYWQPSAEEVEALGEYLNKGGFLIVDDFRGPRELDNLVFHLKRALPEASILPVEDTHDIFDSFFRLIPDDIVPPYGGYPALWLGIYEDNDPAKRIMVMINANNDMAEYWEFSDVGYFPIDISNEAYKLGVNYVVYAMTH